MKTENKNISFLINSNNKNPKTFISYEKYLNEKIKVHKNYMLFFILYNFIFLMVISFSFVFKISNLNDSSKCRLFIIIDFYWYFLLCLFWIIIYIKNSLININEKENKFNIILINQNCYNFICIIMELIFSFLLFYFSQTSCNINMNLFEFGLLCLKSFQFLIQFIIQMIYTENVYKNLEKITGSEKEESLDNGGKNNFTHSTFYANSTMLDKKNKDNTVYSCQNNKDIKFSKKINDISMIKQSKNLSITNDKSCYNSFLNKLNKK